MSKNTSVEFKVGIFTIIGLIFFVSLGIHFSRTSSEVRGKDYYIVFDFLNGLQQGAAIRYSGGILVGKVLSIEPYKNRAKLHVVVSNKIPVDNYTKFSIMSNGLLGEKYINVSLNSPSSEEVKNLQPVTPLKEGATIEGVADIGFDKLLSGVTALAEEMSKVMVPLAQILNRLQETNELPKLLLSLRTLINSGNNIIVNNKDNISNILKTLQSIMRKIDKGKGALGKILNDPVFAQSLGDVLDNIDVLIGKISNNPLISSSNGRSNKQRL